MGYRVAGLQGCRVTRLQGYKVVVKFKVTGGKKFLLFLLLSYI